MDFFVYNKFPSFTLRYWLTFPCITFLLNKDLYLEIKAESIPVLLLANPKNDNVNFSRLSTMV